MKSTARQMLSFCVALLPMLCAMQNPLHADELSELYLNSSSTDSTSSIGPNILIILDTSGSMTEHDLPFPVDPAKFWNAPYDKDTIYDGPCDANMVYRRDFNTDTDLDGDVDIDDVREGNFQSCDSDNKFPLAAVTCRAVLQNGVTVDRFGEFRPYTPGPGGNYEFDDRDLDGEWHSISSSFNGLGSIDGEEIWRECAADAGNHGPRSFSTYYRWPADGDSNFGFTNVEGNAVNFAGERLRLVATGNYINYYRWAQTRLAAVQTALREVIAELPSESHIGVIRFDVKTGSEGSSEGGYVMKEVARLGDGNNRNDVIEAIFAIDPADEGGTPLAESLFEALQVFRGGTVWFGADAQRWNIDRSKWPWDSNITTYTNVSSVAASLADDTSKYESPIQYECQKNAVILLSDGDPSGDNNADNLFKYLPNASNYNASNCDSSAPNSCLREIADYMAHEDLEPLLAGVQTVTTHTVGFGNDISENGQAFLRETADRGNGTFTMANSYESLKHAFEVIFRDEIADNVSQSSPAVTVNAFNRLAHRDDLYFTMFDPIYDSLHWPGNIKKYKLAQQDDGEYRIVDANGNPALATNSSELVFDALSFWTDPTDPLVAANGGEDGEKTPLGGAAGELTDSHLANRKIYTWLGSANNLTNIANRFAIENLDITSTMLGLDDASPIRDELIEWVRGVDTSQSDWQTNPTSRRSIGAAPHGVPAIVTYGEDEATATQVIYSPTNDGFLHAIDAETGEELWAFVPTEVMGSFADMHTPPTPSYIHYGLDASIIHHTEGAGTTKKEWLFFGMRRGGHSLYALDVTDVDSPVMMWRIEGGVDDGFETLAQTWSDPRIATMKLGASDTDGTSVLVFGGGYDTSTQDSAAANIQYQDDTVGNSLFIVNAIDGALLWRAGNGDDISADLPVSDMKSSIVAGVEIKDKNGDGLTDLIYAADLGGRIFRFDVDNDLNQSDSLSITGGKIATLGAGDNSSTSNADNRKFFATPDVVLVAKNGLNHWAINIGSGDRERPKSNMNDIDSGVIGTQNYLFSVKDPHVFTAPSSYDYGITIDELYDATDNAVQEGTATEQASALAALQASDGWKIALPHNGEKALAEAKTFNFRIFFTTFDPTPLDTGNCNSLPGHARLYSLDLLTAGAVVDVDGDGTFTADDRSSDLTHGTIPPSVTLLFLENEDGMIEVTNIIGRSDKPANLGEAGTVRRTYWNTKGNDETEQ